MADPTPKPEGYDPKRFAAQATAQGQKINLWAMLLAEEVSYNYPNKDTADYLSVASEFYANLELLSQGQRLPGNPSDGTELPDGITPNPLEDMRAWLQSNKDRLHLTDRNLANMDLSATERANYHFLSTRTPVTAAEGTYQPAIVFTLGMSGGVGFKTREDFLGNYFKVPPNQLAALGQQDQDPPPVTMDEVPKRNSGEPALGRKQATPKEALGVLSKLDIEDMEKIVPVEIMQSEADTIRRIVELAKSLNAKIGERDGNLVIQASTPEELAQIEKDAKELQEKAGKSRALYTYSPNFLDYESFKNDPDSIKPGSIYSHTSVVAGIGVIENAAHAKLTGQQIDPAAAQELDRLLDSIPLPGDEQGSVAPRGSAVITFAQSGFQSKDQFSKEHPDVPTDALDKGAANLERLRQLSIDPNQSEEDRAFFRDTWQQLERAGSKILTVPEAGKPEPQMQKPDQRGDVPTATPIPSQTAEADRGHKWDSLVAGVYLSDLVKPANAQAPSIQADLPQVMAENTQVKKSSYLA